MANASTSAGLALDLSVKNLAGVARNLRAFDAICVAAIQDAVLSAGESTRELAYALCPVDTGYMRDHLKTVYSPDGLTFEVGWDAADFEAANFADETSTGSFYPIYQEFGTRFMAAQPSLTPAYRETVPHFRADVGDALRASIARFGSGGAGVE
jgi:HK97 gp10 family phage protein